MAQNPIANYSYVLEDGLTPLTYWRSTWNGSAWSSPAVKIFDSGQPATFLYTFGAGQTSDGTHLGMSISHSVAGTPPDPTTLMFLGDGIPASPVDMSSGNTLSAYSLFIGAVFHNAAYYQICYDNTAIRVVKSATGANPWTEVDAAHHPAFGSGPNFTFLASGNNSFRVTGTKIDIFCIATGSPSQIFLYTFDIAAELWTGPYGVFTFSPGQVVNVVGGCFDGVVRFPNGDIAGIYNNQNTSHFAYKVFNGTSWGAEFATPVTIPGTAYCQTIVDSSVPETMNIWFKIGLAHSTTFSYYTATHTGTISGSPVYTTRSMDVFSGGGFGRGTALNGTQYVPITDPSLTTEGVWIGSGASLTETQLPIPAPDVGVTPNAAAYMIDFFSSPLALACPLTNTFTVGVFFSAAVVASGGTPPYVSFVLIAGSLPPGLTLNTVTGVISGVPLIGGTFSYTIQVTDSSAATVQVTCALSSPFPLGLLCPTTTIVLEGQAYSFKLNPVGGVPPFTFAIIGGSLPPGLTLNTSTGVISGTATASGTFTYTVQVTDANGSTASTTCPLTSSTCPPPL